MVGKIFNLICIYIYKNNSLSFAVPCVPTGVSVVLDCATAEAHVSWNASMGALSYTAFAWNSQFNFISCSSTGPVTHCSLSDLICGDDYSIQVIAVGDECTSLPSQTEHFFTGTVA